MNLYLMTRIEATGLGMEIDSHCYPNVAYMGPRFKPSAWFVVPTEAEEALINRLEEAEKLISGEKV